MSQVSQQSLPQALQLIYESGAFFVEVDLEIDARGQNCPMPLLKAKQGLRQLETGQQLRVLATDAGSLKDFVAFTELTAHQLSAFAEAENVFCYLIKKG